MQQLNQRSETSSKNTSTNSVVDNANSNSVRESGNASSVDSQVDEPRRLSLAELFAENDGENTDDSSDDPSKPPNSMESLSKRLGLKPEQVYDVKIPMPQGAEALTIGQLKDRVGELVDFETREAQFEQRRIKSEGDLLRAQAEMRDLLGMVPKEHITPEIIDKLRKRHDDTMRRERALTLDHIPEWRDETKRTEDLQGMIDLLSDYGFDESFITTVQDHRAIKFIRDMYLRDKRIKAALAKVTTPEGKGHRPSSKTKKPATKPNVNSDNRKQTVPNQRTRIAAIFGDK